MFSICQFQESESAELRRQLKQARCQSLPQLRDVTGSTKSPSRRENFVPRDCSIFGSARQSRSSCKPLKRPASAYYVLGIYTYASYCTYINIVYIYIYVSESKIIMHNACHSMSFCSSLLRWLAPKLPDNNLLLLGSMALLCVSDWKWCAFLLPPYCHTQPYCISEWIFLQCLHLSLHCLLWSCQRSTQISWLEQWNAGLRIGGLVLLHLREAKKMFLSTRRS